MNPLNGIILETNEGNLMIKFAIRNKKTGNYLRFSWVHNPSDTEGELVSFELVDSTFSPIWFIDSLEKAEKVLKVKTPWYNADYNSPTLRVSESLDNYEIVEVELRPTS